MSRRIRAAVYRSLIRAAGEGAMLRRLADLQQMQWWSQQDLDQYKRKRLRDVLLHAGRSCARYRQLVPSGVSIETATEVLQSLPLLSKRDLQHHVKDLMAEGYHARTVRKTTGGSTGEPVSVLKDRQTLAFERAAMWLAYGWFGIEMGDRSARFWGVPFTVRRRLQSFIADIGMNRIRFSAFAFEDSELDHYWRRLERFRPDYLHGYVSMLEQMARFAQRRGLNAEKLDLKLVVATSEVLADPQRSLIEEVFRAPVQIEYGCGELGPIAHECPSGSLHLMTPNLWVEVLDEHGEQVAQGESGEIVLTDLHNRSMPLIRYRVGDFGILGSPCECGRALPTLARIWGREYDYVVGQGGKKYHGEFFMYVFEDLRDQGLDIDQFQVQQVESDRLRILVRSPRSLDSEAVGRIRNLLRDRLSGFDVDVTETDEIPRAASGKMRVIENRLLRNETREAAP